MKKTKIKTILGATIVAASISSNLPILPKKNIIVNTSNLITKIKDKSESQDSINDGSKSERAST